MPDETPDGGPDRTPDGDPDLDPVDPKFLTVEERTSIRRRLRAGEAVKGYYLDTQYRLRKVVPRLRPAPPPPDPTEVVPGAPPDTPFDQYEAMRHVLAAEATRDVTPGQRYCRAWAEKKPDDFMAAFSALSVARAAASAAGSPPGADSASAGETGPDERDEAIAELIEQCLARVEKELGHPPTSLPKPRGSPGSG